jgi:hypothetical protein
MEAFRYAVGCNLDAVAVFGRECAILEGGGEEVDDSKRQALT